MAISLVNSLGQQSTTSNGFVTSSIDTSGANLLVVGIGFYSLGNITLVDNKSNDWVEAVSTTFSDYLLTVILYYAKNAITGSDHSFQITGGFNFPSICVLAFSGSHLTAPLDQTASDSDGGGIVGVSTPPSITPTENNEVVVCCVGQDTASIDSSFTREVNNDGAGGLAYSSAIAYLVQGTASSAQPTWTMDTGHTSEYGPVVIASFKSSFDPPPDIAQRSYKSLNFGGRPVKLRDQRVMKTFI